MTCLAACRRQENPISTSTYKFPNKIFLVSPDLLLLIRKLSWSCKPNITRFGPKRAILDLDYPKLCPFFDDFIYTKDVERLLYDDNFFNTTTVTDFLSNLSMDATQLAEFKNQLMTYASSNLVKVNVYIESPYVTTYQTDQVSQGN